MTVDGSGLNYEPDGDEAYDRLRRQAQSLNALHVDVGRSRGFGLGPADSTEMIDGLVAEDDPGALAERLRAMRAREADLKVQRLLERAERAAEQDDLDGALRLVDEALGLDRTSASAWLLRGRCLAAAGRFAEARQAIAVARKHAKDPAGVRLADALRTECDRAELRDLTAALDELIGQGDLVEAARRIQDRLKDRPDDPILLHNWCAVLLLSDSVDAARSVAEDALRTVGNAEAGRFEMLLRHIAERECEPRIRDARLALRRGDTRTALNLLEQCAGALGDNEQFQAIRSYAIRRHADRASFALVGRARRRNPDATPIADGTLQRLIEWLVQEELGAGWAAIQREDFAAASSQFEAAEAIEDRSHLIAFLHAAALFRGLVAQLENKRKPSLDATHDALAEAARFAARATGDPEVGPAARQLAGTIRQSLSTVAEVQRQVGRAQDINRCFARFNSLVKHYQRYPVRTVDQKINAKRSFETLRAEVALLRTERSTDPQEAAALHDLAEAIGAVQRQLR